MGKFYGTDEKVSKKDWLTSLILCWFFGFLGIHRLYAGKVASGISMMSGTIGAIWLATINKDLGALGFVAVGSFVLYDFLTILFKCFKDTNGKEIAGDTVGGKDWGEK